MILLGTLVGGGPISRTGLHNTMNDRIDSAKRPFIENVTPPASIGLLIIYKAKADLASFTDHPAGGRCGKMSRHQPCRRVNTASNEVP